MRIPERKSCTSVPPVVLDKALLAMPRTMRTKAAEDALLPFQLLRAAQQVENLFIVVDAHTVLRRILAVHQLRKRHMNYVAEFLDDAVIRHTLSVLPF